MKRWLLLVAVVCCVLTAGCTQGGSTGSSSIASVAESTDAVPKNATIPALEFVETSATAPGDAAKPGATLTPGSYKPAVSGRSLTTVQWIVDESDGINHPALSLQFSPSGTAKLAKLTETAGKRVFVVLGGRVLDEVVVSMPITSGAWVLGSPGVVAARSEIDSDTVPTQ